MTYILVALKAEAQAFVDKYKLTDYKNNDLHIVISGIGRYNMYESTKKLLSSINENDLIVNIGICGASSKFRIGDLIEIDIDTLQFNDSTLKCVDSAVYEKHKYDIVDMESSGFLKATQGIKNRHVYKIVSDNFEPNSVTKDKTKQLIFNKIDEIMEKLKI